MSTESRILATLHRLRGEGHNKAGRLREALLGASEAVRDAEIHHKEVMNEAANYTTDIAVARYRDSKAREGRRMYGHGYYHGQRDTAYTVNAKTKLNPDWVRGYEAGKRSIGQRRAVA